MVEFLFRKMDTRSLSRPLQPSEKKRKQWTSQLASLADVGDLSGPGVIDEKDLASHIHQTSTIDRAIHPALRSNFAVAGLVSQQASLATQEDFESADSAFRSDSSTKYDSADDTEKGTKNDSLKNMDSPSGSTTPTTITSGPQNEVAGVNLTVRLEGPYFTAANPIKFDTIVCLVAGTGITGAIAIASGFRARRALRPTPTSRAFDEERQDDAQISAQTGECTRCIVVWSVREDDFVEIPVINGKGLSSSTDFGNSADTFACRAAERRA